VHFKSLFVTENRQDSEHFLNDCYNKPAVGIEWSIINKVMYIDFLLCYVYVVNLRRFFCPEPAKLKPRQV
jgi:hypothetical protein